MSKVDDIITHVREVMAPQLGAGSRLPTEDKLREKFGVSKQTIRIAMIRLQAAGVIESVAHGKWSGHYIAESRNPNIAYREVAASGKSDRHKDRQSPSSYVVTLADGQPVACTCPAWQFATNHNKLCKHQKMFDKETETS